MIQVMPGYWFEHNMYAVVRNAHKYRARDKRVVKEQNVEYDFLAPDTAEEMMRGMEILRTGIEGQIGRQLNAEDLESCEKIDASVDLCLEGLANGRKAKILHPLRGYLWYRKMLRFYGAKELKTEVEQALSREGGGQGGPENMVQEIKSRSENPHRSWENIGGQLIPEPQLAELIRGLSERRIGSWDQLHQAYDDAWEEYPQHKTAHALYCLLYSYDQGVEELSPDLVRRILEESIEIAKELLQRAYASRRKDYENPYRQATFRNPAEMEAVWGKLEDISFLKSYTAEIDGFCREVKQCLSVFS